MSSREWRYAGAVFIGVIFEAVFLWKFRPYTAREHGPDLLPWYWLPVLAFVAGLLLTLGFDGKKRWIPVALLGVSLSLTRALAPLVPFRCQNS